MTDCCVAAFGNLRMYRTESGYELAWITHDDAWQIISRDVIDTYPLTLEGQAQAISALWSKGVN